MVFYLKIYTLLVFHKSFGLSHGGWVGEYGSEDKPTTLYEYERTKHIKKILSN